MFDNEFHNTRRTRRLRRKRDFGMLFLKGRRLKGRFFSILVYRREGESERIAFSTEKGMGNAVWRNRAKRRMREAYRLRRIATEDGLDLVFIARRAILAAEFGDVESEMSRFFHEIQRMQC